MGGLTGGHQLIMESDLCNLSGIDQFGLIPRA